MLSPSAKRDEEHGDETRRLAAPWETLSVGEVVVSVLKNGQGREYESEGATLPQPREPRFQIVLCSISYIDVISIVQSVPD